MTRQQKYKIQTIARYIILIAVGLVMIYPMIWMVGASFKATNAEIFDSIGFIPKEFTLDGYKNGWFASTYQFGRYMVNTYKFVIPKVIGTVVSSAIAAYGFSRFQFKARGFWFALMLSTLFLPQVVLNVPQFLLFTKWGWVDSYLPLVVPSFFACDTYFVFMLVQFMRGISRELEEAAKIIKATPANLQEKLEHLMADLKSLQAENESLKSKAAKEALGDVMDQVQDVNGVKLLAVSVADVDMNGLRDLGDQLKEKLGEGVVVLASAKDGKVNLIAMATDAAMKQGAHAGNLIKGIAALVGGGGGGRPNMAQAGGKNPAGIEEALKKAVEVVEEQTK